MKEEEIIFNEKPQNLLKILFKEELIDELKLNGYKIYYFGEKSSSYLESIVNNFPLYQNNLEKVLPQLKNAEDKRNFILYIKYKDIYIGGFSIFDFQSKEGFGLYKYLNMPDNPFYLGQWEENQKSGKGFLKIDNNHLYVGNFKNNQMNGEGLYYNKKNGNYYYGEFNDGIFKKGLFCNLLKDIFYIGIIQNDKKNDDYCYYYNSKNDKIFIGEIKNDLFIKGYIIFLLSIEKEKSIDIKIDKIIYYEKNKKNKSPKIIKKKNNEFFEKIIYDIIQAVNYIKDDLENMKFFEEIEGAYNDTGYNNSIGRYNNYQNEFSFEKEFLNNYDFYLRDLKSNIKKIKDLNNIEYK